MKAFKPLQPGNKAPVIPIVFRTDGTYLGTKAS
jgi:hypothetical protein